MQLNQSPAKMIYNVNSKAYRMFIRPICMVCYEAHRTSVKCYECTMRVCSTCFLRMTEVMDLDKPTQELVAVVKCGQCRATLCAPVMQLTKTCSENLELRSLVDDGAWGMPAVRDIDFKVILHEEDDDETDSKCPRVFVV